MHELPVTESILKIAVDEAKKHDAKKVLKISIKMGVLSDLLPECINSYFDILSKGTIAEGAVVCVEKLPLRVLCNECKEISKIEIRHFRCPSCGSQNLKIIGGNEFYIDNMEVE